MLLQILLCSHSHDPSFLPTHTPPHDAVHANNALQPHVAHPTPTPTLPYLHVLKPLNPTFRNVAPPTPQLPRKWSTASNFLPTFSFSPPPELQITKWEHVQYPTLPYPTLTLTLTLGYPNPYPTLPYPTLTPTLPYHRVLNAHENKRISIVFPLYSLLYFLQK